MREHDAHRSPALVPGPLDPFLAACGANGPLIVDVARPGAATETRTFVQPFVIVGRLPRSDIALNGAEVSRRHVYFQLVEGRLYGVDLGTRSGTAVAGQPLQAGWTGAGQDVAIGEFGLRFRPAGPGLGAAGDASDATDPRSAAFGDQRPALSPAALEVTDSSGRAQAWTMRGALALIGQGPLARPCLRGYGVSHYHCSLVRTPQGLWAVDLLTEWGTTHNGMSMRACRLAPGDRLGVGPFTIHVRECRSDLPVRVRPQTAPVPSPTTEWLPADRSPATVPGAGVLPRDVVDRLQALECRQDAMQGQFQQAMMLMLQAFGGMHREQMELLASEMAEVRRLSEAIDGLRAELARTTAATPADSTDGPSPAPGDIPGDDLDPAMPDPDIARVRRDPREVHEFVSARLAAFERERQSRWSRILSTLTGAS